MQRGHTGGVPAQTIFAPPRKEPFMAISRRYAALVFSATLTLSAASAWAGSTVSFANDLQPIFDARCIRCHNPDLLSGGMDLTSDNSYANLVEQPTSDGCMAEVPGSVRVVEFDPMSSMLWLKTLPDDSRCGVPMPRGTQGLGVIAPDEFTILETWIVEGAQNN